MAAPLGASAASVSLWRTLEGEQDDAGLKALGGDRRCGRIEAKGARLVFPLPYSPDFNPIENALATLKASLFKAAERTVTGLWRAIGKIIEPFTPAECAHDFAAAGYDPDVYDSALGSVDIHLRVRSEATRCMAVRKLVSVLS